MLRGTSSAVTGLHIVNTVLGHPDGQFPYIFLVRVKGPTGVKPDFPVDVVVSPTHGRPVFWSDYRASAPKQDPPLASECRLQTANPADTVASFYACMVELGGARTLVIAAATEAGVESPPFIS